VFSVHDAMSSMLRILPSAPMKAIDSGMYVFFIQRLATKTLVMSGPEAADALESEAFLVMEVPGEDLALEPCNVLIVLLEVREQPAQQRALILADHYRHQPRCPACGGIADRMPAGSTIPNSLDRPRI